MATTKKKEEKRAELVLVPWAAVSQIRVSEEPQDFSVEYDIKSRWGKQLPCFDLTGLIAAPGEPGKLDWNPRLIAVENPRGKGWTHRWQGWSDDPYLYNAVMEKLINRHDFLLMRRDGTRGWHVLGNELGGRITLRTGGYTSSSEGRWCEGEILSYEFTCDCQQYMECDYKGELNILPTTDLFTKF